MKPPQIIGDLARPEVVVLSEIQDLAHHIRRRRPRRAARCSVPTANPASPCS
jgi:hypothetical protein